MEVEDKLHWGLYFLILRKYYWPFSLLTQASRHFWLVILLIFPVCEDTPKCFFPTAPFPPLLVGPLSWLSFLLCFHLPHFLPPKDASELVVSYHLIFRALIRDMYVGTYYVWHIYYTWPFASKKDKRKQNTFLVKCFLRTILNDAWLGLYVLLAL